MCAAYGVTAVRVCRVLSALCLTQQHPVTLPRVLHYGSTAYLAVVTLCQQRTPTPTPAPVTQIYKHNHICVKGVIGGGSVICVSNEL